MGMHCIKWRFKNIGNLRLIALGMQSMRNMTPPPQRRRRASAPWWRVGALLGGMRLGEDGNVMVLEPAVNLARSLSLLSLVGTKKGIAVPHQCLKIAIIGNPRSSLVTYIQLSQMSQM